MGALIVILGVLGLSYLAFHVWGKKPWKTPSGEFPSKWRIILTENVAFYNALSAEEKKQFEYRVQEFLLNHRVTGIQTTIDDTDRLLVASSAIIPIFNFPDWRYTNLFEVLVYPSSFNAKFETSGDDRMILGMVGTGIMDGKMILSQASLRQGFANSQDKRNTAIHEFVHLIDELDGTIDGIPQLLMDQPSAIPWVKLIQEKTAEIMEEESDINAYGATEKHEFLPVVSEYFFERPKLLASKHPKLYDALEKMFRTDMKERKLHMKTQRIGRNSPCPCGSGKKYKECCMD